MVLVYIGIPYFCDWKPGRFRTTSLRRKWNKFWYQINPFNNLQLQNEHHVLLANFIELANALTINPLLDQLSATMTYQLPLHLKQRNKITQDSSASCLGRLIIACWYSCRAMLPDWMPNREILVDQSGRRDKAFKPGLSRLKQDVW